MKDGKRVVRALRDKVVDEAPAEEALRIIDIDQEIRKRGDDAAREVFGLEGVGIGMEATRATEDAVERLGKRRLLVTGPCWRADADRNAGRRR